MPSAASFSPNPLVSHPPSPPAALAAQGEVAKQKAAKDEHERRKNLTKYIPDVSRSLYSMLEIISDPTGVGAVAGSSAADTARDAAARAAKRPSHLDALVDDVRAKRLKEETLAEKLRTHIEQCEVQSALENVTAAGGARPRQEVYLAPFNEKAPMLSELHHPAFVLKLRADAFVGKLQEGSMGNVYA